MADRRAHPAPSCYPARDGLQLLPARPGEVGGASAPGCSRRGGYALRPMLSAVRAQLALAVANVEHRQTKALAAEVAGDRPRPVARQSEVVAVPADSVVVWPMTNSLGEGGLLAVMPFSANCMSVCPTRSRTTLILVQALILPRSPSAISVEAVVKFTSSWGTDTAHGYRSIFASLPSLSNKVKASRSTTESRAAAVCPCWGTRSQVPTGSPEKVGGAAAHLGAVVGEHLDHAAAGGGGGQL